MGGVGEEFARALAAKEHDRLRQLLDADVEFRGMTPNRFWEAAGPDEVIDVLRTWFDHGDEIEAVESLDSGRFVDRERVDYCFRVRNSDGLHLVRQHAYLRANEGRIAWIRIMCSGFRHVAAESGARPADWREFADAMISALNARDFDAVATLPLHPDLEFHSAVAASEGKVYRGLAGLREWARDVDSIWSDLRIELLEAIEVGTDQAVIAIRNVATARASGVPLDNRGSQLWTWKDGLAYRNQSFTDPREAFRLAGLED